MDKQILNFTVNEQALVVDEPIKISTNKVNYIQANFDLGTNWSGFDSVRAVWFNDFNCISTVLDSLGNCVVPFEVMKRKGNVKVNLVGSISEDDVLTDRLTSYPVVAVIVDCTAQINGANTQPITPSEFEQFAQRVHTDAERAETAASNAETSAQNASDSATSAHNSAESAHDDKIAIEEAIAEVIQQIEDFEQVQVVVNTLPPTSPATSDFTDGVLTLGIPQGVKGDTGNGIQSIRKTGTSGLVDTYTITFTDGQTTTFTVTNGAKGDTGNGISTIEKTSTVGLVDTYTITYTNGNTTTFTVTNGEKGDKGDQGEVSLSELEDATVVQTLSDNTPYNYRRTNNGQGSGHREYDEIVGASVAWNQLVQNGNFENTSHWTSYYGATFTAQDNVATIVGNGNASGSRIFQDMPRTPSHKYFVAVAVKTDGVVGATITTDNLGSVSTNISPTTSWTNVYRIADSGSYANANIRFHIRVWSSQEGTVYAKNAQLVDLTLFNSQIADYVYSLEQSTAGSGVTWLKSHFPKLFDNGYQPFDSGSLKSVNGLTAHEMVGVNWFDKSTATDGKYINPNSGEATDATRGHSDFIRVFPSTKIYMNGYAGQGYYSVLAYDENKNAIGSFYGGASKTAPFSCTLPSNCHYVVLNYMLAQKETMCFSIYDESINGQYFPYEKHAYPLDSTLTLRGVPKLDASNNLYFDGDVYKSDGAVTRKYGVVDLGTLNWLKYSAGENYIFGSVGLGGLNYGAAEGIVTMMSSKYVGVGNATSNYGAYTRGDMTCCSLVGGDKRIYIRDDSKIDGTVDAFKASLSGVYLVYELATPTTEQATPYTSPQWCDSHGTEEYIGSELPVGHNTDYPMSLSDTVPTASGNYTLKCTVTDGKPTFTWQNA